MKVKGFLKDVGGASRVTKARLEAFASASPEKRSVASARTAQNGLFFATIRESPSFSTARRRSS